MAFKFATERENYSAYAGGQVFYNLPGRPAFPVRLASEIFQRCLHLRSAKGLPAPVRLYDPCCGGAYHLAVLAYLHWDKILEISASDINGETLSVAQRNLSLLTPDGLQQRTSEIEEMQRLYKKDSHTEARHSAGILKEKLQQNLETRAIPVRVFQADALRPGEIRERMGASKPDLVISDIPYGLRSQWILPAGAASVDAVWLLLENLRGVLADTALVAIASGKEQKIAHENYKQVGKLKLGKRQVVMLEKQ